jgi:hypothetical protein
VNPPAPHILGSSGKVQEMSFSISFLTVAICYTIAALSGKAFKARKEKGVLRKTLIETG